MLLLLLFALRCAFRLTLPEVILVAVVTGNSTRRSLSQAKPFTMQAQFQTLGSELEAQAQLREQIREVRPCRTYRSPRQAETPTRVSESLKWL